MSQDIFDYKRYECLPHAERIVCQGLEGTYNNLATVQFFSQYPEVGFSHMKTFDVAMRAVDEGADDHAMLPIENSTADSITDGHGAFAKREVSVVDEYFLPVRHASLACNDTALADVRTVYSHPQGIKQCVPLFEKHPEIKVAVVLDTAAAVQLMQAIGKSSTAAITSTYAGQICSPKVLIPTLNYRTENITHFLIVGKEKLYLCGAKTVSLIMETRHEADAFYHMLGALYAEGINLLRFATRPIPEVGWAHCFFLGFSGSLEEAAIQRALRGVERLGASLCILGCFWEELWR